MANTYDLNVNNFQLLKDIASRENAPQFEFDDTKNRIITDDINAVLMLIDDEITYAGLTDDQQECNDYGRKLYSLYDELYYQ